jgi:hypothetical protein
LEAAAGISGTVTDVDGPVAGVGVVVYGSGGDVAAYTSTDENGTYIVNGVTTGSYTVCFDPSLVSGTDAAQCYPDQAWDPRSGAPAPGATAVDTTDGTETTGIDAALEPAV